MRVILTVGELLDRCKWTELCQMRGWDEEEAGALTERFSTELVLSEQEAQRLGLVAVEVE